MLLPPDEIWIWQVDHAQTLEDCEEVLDSGERARAARFREANVRRRYLTAHAARRLLAAQILKNGTPPSDFNFRINAHGKPDLADLRCSMSHTAALSLIAFTRNSPVGVDLEKIDQSFDPGREIGGRFRFGQDFFPSWVRREACGKVFGRGLSGAINEMEYRTFAFSPAIGFVACAAVPRESTVRRIRLYDFSLALARR